MRRLIICILSLSGCSYIPFSSKYQDDNIVEEIVEAAIKVETGIDLDLSPSSPEK